MGETPEANENGSALVLIKKKGPRVSLQLAVLELGIAGGIAGRRPPLGVGEEAVASGSGAPERNPIRLSVPYRVWPTLLKRCGMRLRS